MRDVFSTFAGTPDRRIIWDVVNRPPETDILGASFAVANLMQRTIGGARPFDHVRQRLHSLRLSVFLFLSLCPSMSCLRVILCLSLPLSPCPSPSLSLCRPLSPTPPSLVFSRLSCPSKRTARTPTTPRKRLPWMATAPSSSQATRKATGTSPTKARRTSP